MAYVSSGMYESSILMRYKTPSSGDYDNDALYTTNITLDSDYAMAFIKTYDVTKQIDNYKLYVFKKGIAKEDFKGHSTLNITSKIGVSFFNKQ